MFHLLDDVGGMMVDTVMDWKLRVVSELEEGLDMIDVMQMAMMQMLLVGQS